MVSNGKTESSVKRLFSGNIMTSLEHARTMKAHLELPLLSRKIIAGSFGPIEMCTPPLLDGRSPTFRGEKKHVFNPEIRVPHTYALIIAVDLPLTQGFWWCSVHNENRNI